MSYAEFHYAECHYAKCHYAECHYAEGHYAECHYAQCHYAEGLSPSIGLTQSPSLNIISRLIKNIYLFAKINNKNLYKFNPKEKTNPISQIATFLTKRSVLKMLFGSNPVCNFVSFRSYEVLSFAPVQLQFSFFKTFSFVFFAFEVKR